MNRRIFLFLLVVAAVFSPLLFFPYVYDDRVVVENNTLLRSFSSFPRIWSGQVDGGGEMNGVYRPLFLTILSITGNLTGFHPGALRFISMLLHALNGALLYWLAVNPLGISARFALWAVLFFLIHPIQMTSIDLVWKQSDLWCGFILLLSLQRLFSAPSDRKTPWLLALLFVSALLIKESALVFPLVWLGAEFLLPAIGRAKRFSLYVVVLATTLLYYFSLRRLVPAPPEMDGFPGSRWQYWATECTVFVEYAKAIVVPSLSSLDRAIPLSLLPLKLIRILSAAFFLIAGGMLIYGLRRFPKPMFVVWLALCWLIPTSTLQPLALLYDETRLYLFLGMLFIFLAQQLAHAPIRLRFSPHLGQVALILIALTLSTSAFALSFRFQSEVTIWKNVLDVDPRSARALYQLGLLSQDARALDDAENYYVRAIQVSPGMESATLNLGIVVGQKGDLQRAEYLFSSLLASRQPTYVAKGHYHLGLHATYLGDVKKAHEHFENTRKLLPQLADKGEEILQRLAEEKGVR